MTESSTDLMESPTRFCCAAGYQGSGSKTEEEFVCHKCSESFGTMDHLARHIRVCFSVEESSDSEQISGSASSLPPTQNSFGDFTCNNCQMIFHTPSDLRKHLSRCGGLAGSEVAQQGDAKSGCRPAEGQPGPTRSRRKRDENKLFSCRQCNKAFANAFGLKNHIKMHNNDRPHVCPKCCKAFVLMSCLKTHLNNFHSEAKYGCTFPGCAKEFKSANYVKVHMLTHTQVKNFECIECDKRFIDKQALKLHMRSHTGERPYGCGSCGKKFIQINHLKTHERLHTGEKPFVCEHCGKSFRQVSNLIEHRNNNHRDV